jgi:hypothetical protein
LHEGGHDRGEEKMEEGIGGLIIEDAGRCMVQRVDRIGDIIFIQIKLEFPPSITSRN